MCGRMGETRAIPAISSSCLKHWYSSIKHDEAVWSMLLDASLPSGRGKITTRMVMDSLTSIRRGLQTQTNRGRDVSQLCVTGTLETGGSGQFCMSRNSRRLILTIGGATDRVRV